MRVEINGMVERNAWDYDDSLHFHSISLHQPLILWVALDAQMAVGHKPPKISWFIEMAIKEGKFLKDDLLGEELENI